MKYSPGTSGISLSVVFWVVDQWNDDSVSVSVSIYDFKPGTEQGNIIPAFKLPNREYGQLRYDSQSRHIIFASKFST